MLRSRVTRRHILAGALALTVPVTIPSASLGAQEPVSSPAPGEAPKFGIHPVGETEHGYPELDIAPGERGEVRIGITMSGTVPAEVTLYRANTIPAAGGGFAAAELDIEPTGHTLWLDIEPTSFLAEPGNTYEFTVPVAVPADALPGQYVAGLVVQTIPLAIGDTTMFTQIIRSAMSVVINVPGEITPGMELGAPEVVTQGGKRVIRIPITNTGNILIRPEGDVVMTTLDGDEILSAEIAMKSIYLGMANEIRVAIPDQVPLGDYLVSYDIAEPAYGLRASMKDVPVTIAEIEPEATPEQITFSVDDVTVTPVGDPVQYADVTVSLTNNRQVIPTARISLVAMREDKEVETYDLSVNQAIPAGESTVSQRYIPAGGWESGTWTFRLAVVAVDGAGTETLLAEIDVEDTVTIP